MGKNPVTGLRDGEPFTILVDVDEAEIERRRQAALARRAARDAPAAAPPADRSWAGR
jgi:hypothetical protein